MGLQNGIYTASPTGSIARFSGSPENIQTPEFSLVRPVTLNMAKADSICLILSTAPTMLGIRRHSDVWVSIFGYVERIEYLLKMSTALKGVYMGQ